MKHRLFVLITLISAVSIGNFHLNYREIHTPLINQVFPIKIDNWEAKDAKVDKSVYSMIDKNELLLRTYKNKNDNQIINLAIVLTNKRDHIHDPDICYRGQGITFNKEYDKAISAGNIVKYILGKRGNDQYDLMYWYTDLNKIYPSRSNFMRHITISKFIDKPMTSFGLVVLISPKIKQDESNLIDFAGKVNSILNRLNKENKIESSISK